MTKSKPALGSDVLAPHPVDLYAAAPTGRRAGRAASPARLGGTPKKAKRPQLNALMRSWDEVARVRAIAFVRRVDARAVVMDAIACYEKTLTPAERRAIQAETERLAAAYR